MKLIRETTFDVSYLLEGEGDGRDLYIEGVYIEGEVRNGNNRVYPMPVLEGAVNKYRIEKIDNGSATGELDHPDEPHVSLKNASHRIISLERHGKTFVGKSLVLDTIQGNQVRGLHKGGVKMGMSTRGLGSIGDQGIVQPDFLLCTVDIVSDPSAPNAFVNGILEGKEWICENGAFVPRDIDKLRAEIKKAPQPIKHSKILEAFEKFMKVLGQS